MIPVCSYGVVSTFPSEASVEPEYHEVIIPPKLSSNHFPILTIRYLLGYNIYNIYNICDFYNIYNIRTDDKLNLSSPRVIIEGSSRYTNCRVSYLPSLILDPGYKAPHYPIQSRGCEDDEPVAVKIKTH